MEESVKYSTIRVELSREEIAWGTSLGPIRFKIIKEKKVPHHYGTNDEKGNQNQTIGAFGEMAFAKRFELPFDGTANILAKADFGRYCIRSTVCISGHLLIHPEDQDHLLGVLAIVRLPVVILAGWIRVELCKNDVWWQDRAGENRWCYWVPQYALAPMHEFELAAEPSLF